MAVNLTASRSTSLFPGGDADGDGKFDPGDVVVTRIRLTIDNVDEENNGFGDDNATNIDITDTISGVHGVTDVKVTPIAFDDSYGLTGNTPKSFSAAQGLLANDDDPDGAGGNAGLTVSSVDTTGTQGTVAFSADGSFTFTPTTGFVGVTSFKYFVQDAQNLNNVTEGIVTMTVTGKVWYVDNTASAVGADGSYLHPFTTMGDLSTGGAGDAADGAGDTIFVYHNGGAYTGGIVLEANQLLYGDGEALLVNNHNIGGAERTGGADVLTNAVINHAGDGITLATNNTIKGLDVNGTANGAVGIVDAGNVGTLVIDNSSVTGQGKAVLIDSGGSVTIDLDLLSSSNSSSEGVQLQGLTGTFNASGGTISTSTGAAVLIGAANGLTASSGGSVDFTYGGNITDPGGSIVNIQDRTGGTIDFNGTLSDTTINAGQFGIQIDQSSGTINFDGQTTINTGAGTGHGVVVTNNSAAVSFNGTGNGFDVTTTTGTGMSFSGTGGAGGSLTVTGTGNTINTGTGQTLSIVDSGIGNSGIAFNTLHSGNVAAGNAININNLDGSGTFSGGAVDVDGTAGASADGLNISNSSATFTFASATIDNTGGDGIEINGQTSTQGAVTFTTIDLDGMVSGNGVNIAGVQSTVNINNGTIGTGGAAGPANDPGGDGVNINGGTGAVTVVAAITKNSAGGNEAVDISGHSGGDILFSGAINTSGGSGGIRMVNNTGANIAFTSGTMNLNTGTNAGITFTNTAASGSNVSFTGGNLNIDTTTGTGINTQNTNVAAATNPIGSLTISGANNVIDVGNGRAVIIDGVSENVTLLHVNATGVTSGTTVFLQNAGTGGGNQFFITGTGTTATTGGIINHNSAAATDNLTSQGTGVYLNNVGNISLSNMDFTGTFGNFGIRGDKVNNFTLKDSNLVGTYGTNLATGTDEGTIRFGSQASFGNNGLTGAALFSGNTVSGGKKDNVAIFDYGTGTLNVTFQDSAAHQATFGNTQSGGNIGIHIQTGGSAGGQGGGFGLTASINALTFTGGTADQIFVSAEQHTNQNLTITNNTFTNSQGDKLGGNININSSAAADTNYSVTYNVSNNTMTGAVTGPIVAYYKGLNGTVTGVIDNNTIGNFADAVTDSSGSSQGNGIFVALEKISGAGTLNSAVRISNNKIADLFQAAGGIAVRASNAGSGSENFETTIINNQIKQLGAQALSGIYVQLGGQGSGDIGVSGLDIHGNNINLVGSGAFTAIDLDQNSLAVGAHFNIPGYLGSVNGENNGGTASTNLSTFWGGLNTINANGGSNAYAGDARNITHNAFAFGVPIMMAPDPFVAWEDDPTAYHPAPTPSPNPDQTSGQGGESHDPVPGDSGGSTGGTGSDGGSTGGGSSDPATPVVNDNVLTQAELNYLVDAAIQRWIDAGATPEQVAAMRAVDVGIIDMAGVYLGAAETGTIKIDSDGAGRGWFVDATPGEDSEFAGSGTDLDAVAGGAAAGKVDLLTVLMHELGHQIGLDDTYRPADSGDLMYGYLSVGERHLPADGEAAGATPGTVDHEAFELTAPHINTLPHGKTVDVYFRSTLDEQVDDFAVSPFNTSTIKFGGVTVATPTETIIIDTMTIGDHVFKDVNKNGVFDGGDTGIVNVAVQLYADTNDSGGWDAGDVLVGSTTTLAGGAYSFSGLAHGDYIVVLTAANFGAGQPLQGLLSVAGGTDPDDNIDNDDNGLSGVVGLGAGIASQTITLTANSEPDGTPGGPGDDDTDSDPDTNLTLDFGFFTPNAAPVLNNVDGNISGFLEGGAVTRLDLGSDASLTDDQANFSGGTLTVHIGTGLDAGEDQLVIDPASTVTVNGSNHVLVGATDIGTVSGGGAGGGDFVFSFTSAATPALVQTLIQALAYNNSNTVDPSTDTRSISLTLVDGGGTDGGAGADTTVVNVLVNVTDVNDAPSGAATANDTTNDTTTLVFDETNFNTGYSDPDHNLFTGIVISSLPATGTLKLGPTAIVVGDLPVTVTLGQLTGGALTFVPTAGSGGMSPTFDFAVRDDGLTLNGGVDTDQTPGTFTIVITPSDIAPVVDLDGAGGTLNFASSYSEGGAAAAIADTDVDITDADAGDDIHSATITITNAVANDLLTVGGLPAGITVDPSSTATMVKLVGIKTQVDYETALKAITFSNTGNDPTAHNSNTSRTISVTVNDGDLNSGVANAIVSVTDVNDDPTGTSSTITAAEDTFRLLDPTDFGFGDVDGNVVNVTISAVTGGKIYTDSDGPGGADPVEETLPHTYAVQDLTDGKVLFKANPNLNGNGVGTITFAAIDDDGATDGSPNVLTVNVTPINDSPVIPDSPDVATNEQVAIVLNSGLAVSDVDLDALNGGQGNYGGTSFGIGRAVPSADDTFSFNTTGASFTVVGNTLKVGGNTIATFGVAGGAMAIAFTSANGTVATKALVNNVLQHIQYTNTSDTPPSSVTLTYLFDDGAPGNAGQGALAAPLGNLDDGQVTVNLTAVNDAPVNTVGSAAGTNEDTAVVLTGVSINDVDALPASVMTVTLSVAHGTLVINTGVGGGITGANITGGANGTNTIVIQATQAQINATLANATGLTYTPAQDYNGTDALSVTTNDGGATGIDPFLTGTPTTEQDQDNKAINITATPDAPVAQPDAISTPENVIGAGNLFANNGSGIDSDADGDTLTISAINGNSLDVGQTITLASGAKLKVNADGTYTYDPFGKFNWLTDNTSGAVNTSTVGDTFQYTLAGGNTVTVTVTVNGVAGAGDILMGDGTNNVINGTPQADFFMVQQGGNDTVNGLATGDGFYFGAAFTAADTVDGGGGTDQLGLQGNYTGGNALVLGNTTIANLEQIILLAGDDTRFGDTANNSYSYDITTVEANVATGQTLYIDGAKLRAGENLTFNGSAESTGAFFIWAGSGTDSLTGGGGNDGFLFRGDGKFTAADTIVGGGGSGDQIGLRGNYNVTLGATTVSGVESIVLMSGHDLRFGLDVGDLNYSLTMNDGNVGNLGLMVIDGGGLRSTETLTFDGSQELNGHFTIFGGAGNDTLTGSQQGDLIKGALGHDNMSGGLGNDSFFYNSTAESTSLSQDSILDFAAGDVIDLHKIDANTALAGNQAFTFIEDDAFGNHAGELRFEFVAGNTWLIQGDTDGNGSADFQVSVTINDLHPITAADFVL